MVDRAPELSIILFSVQLFTVPTIAEMLAREHNFIYILCQILISFFQGPKRRVGPINCNNPPFENRRYFHIFHDFRYILSNEAVKLIVSNRPTYQAQMIACLDMFQGMHTNTRYSLDHVEFETNTWVNAFNVTLQLYKCCRQFADCFTSNPTVLTQVLARTLKKIQEWSDKHEEETPPAPEYGPSAPAPPQVTAAGQTTTEPMTMDVANAPGTNVTIVPLAPNALPKAPQPVLRTMVHTVTMPTTPPTAYEIIKYKVSVQPVSFHHPLHWFLADLLENVDFLDSQELQKIGFDSFRQMMMQFVGQGNETEAQLMFRLQEIFDYPLRGTLGVNSRHDLIVFPCIMH